MTAIIDNFISVYKNMNSNNIDSVRSLYSEDITFIDPFHEIHGLSSLINYFTNLYENVEDCRFDFSDIYAKDKSAMITWDMTFKHRNMSKYEIHVPGCTQMRFEKNISYHRDYFDAGKMVYENIPLVGSIIRHIKKKV